MEGFLQIRRFQDGHLELPPAHLPNRRVFVMGQPSSADLGK